MDKKKKESSMAQERRGSLCEEKEESAQLRIKAQVSRLPLDLGFFYGRREPVIMNLDEVIRLAKSKISISEVMVYEYLLCLENDGKAWPRHKKIAEDLGYSERTVRRCVISLEKRKYIKRRIEARSDGTVYTFCRDESKKSYRTERSGTPAKFVRPTGQNDPVEPDRTIRLNRTERSGSSPIMTYIKGSNLTTKKKSEALPPKLENAPLIPPEFKGLELYEKDFKLCERFPKKIAAWKIAYPDVDIPDLVKKLHAWEMAVPATQRKRDRIRFFHNRIAVTQANTKQRKGWKPPWEQEEEDYIKKVHQFERDRNARKRAAKEADEPI